MHHLAHVQSRAFGPRPGSWGPTRANNLLSSGASEWDFPTFFPNSVNNVSCQWHLQPTLQVLASQLFPVKSGFSYYANSRQHTQRIGCAPTAVQKAFFKKKKYIYAQASPSQPIIIEIFGPGPFFGAPPGTTRFAFWCRRMGLPEIFFHKVFEHSIFLSCSTHPQNFGFSALPSKKWKLYAIPPRLA